MGFLQITLSLHTWLAAEIHLADDDDDDDDDNINVLIIRVRVISQITDS